MADIDEVLISIVIPVKNGEPWLADTIPAILKQRVQGSFEVIIIDSGSTDNTLQILKKFPIRIIKIEPSQFNHGRTRNLGVREARGKYVVMTVQDAKPSDENWLTNLLDGFIDDNVAGVCGQQIVPHSPGNNPIQWYRPVSKSGMIAYHFKSKFEFEQMTPDEQLRYCRWDDVNAIYRKDILLKFPFKEVDFAEDILWAKDMLTNGYTIVYNTHAKVEHYHYEIPDFTFRRNFTVAYHKYLFFGVLPKTNNNIVFQMLKNLKYLLSEKRIEFFDKIKWLRYNYRIQRQLQLSNKLFIKKHQLGAKELKETHDLICATIPQASKKQ